MESMATDDITRIFDIEIAVLKTNSRQPANDYTLQFWLDAR